MEGEGDELAAAFDEEFGQEWAAEDENIEEEGVPQEGGQPAEAADAGMMADADEMELGPEEEEEGNELMGSQFDLDEFAEGLQELQELAAEEGEESPSGSQQQPQSIQQLAAAHAAASATPASASAHDDTTVCPQKIQQPAAAHAAASATPASTSARDDSLGGLPPTQSSSPQQGPAPKRRRTVTPSNRQGAQGAPRASHTSSGRGSEDTSERQGMQGEQAGIAAEGTQQQQQQQCTHPSYWAGMCVCCGALKPEDEGTGAATAAAPAAAAGVAGVGGGSTQSGSTSAAPKFRRAPGRAGVRAPSAHAPAAHGGGTAKSGGDSESSEPSRVLHPPGSGPPSAAPSDGRRVVPPKQGGVGAGASQGLGVGVQGPGVSAQPAEPLTRIRHLHSRGQLEVSMSEAARVRQREVSRLLGEKRLVLVLDLDHTLLHSVRLMDVSPQDTQQLEAILRAQEGQPKQLLHCLRHQNLWTKLRPGVHEFLEACRGLFEMHIYTMGDRSYAAQIRMLLDPHRRLFSSVISQNDSTSTAAKDLDVALADDRIVLILDDTEHVWPHHRRNLLLIERYHFFPGTMRPVNGVSGLLDLRKDESASHGALPTALRVLQNVHARFFASRDQDVGGDVDDITALPLERRDVRYCLVQRREDILKGCRVCFSHCWPQAFPSPHSHPLWQLAEALGAECSTTYNPDTVTHLVAGSSGTEKAVQARRHGKHVVAPDWLRACMFRWHREDEAAYAAAIRPTPQLFLSPLEPLHIPEPAPLPTPSEHPAQHTQGQAPPHGAPAVSAASGSPPTDAAELRALHEAAAGTQPQAPAGQEQGQQAGGEVAGRWDGGQAQSTTGAMPGGEGGGATGVSAGGASNQASAGAAVLHRESASAVGESGGSRGGGSVQGQEGGAGCESGADKGTGQGGAGGQGAVLQADSCGQRGEGVLVSGESGQTGEDRGA